MALFLLGEIQRERSPFEFYAKAQKNRVMEKIRKLNGWYILFTLMLLVLARDFWSQNREIKQVPYSEFETMLDHGTLERIVVSERQMIAQLKNPQGELKYIQTNRVDPLLAERLNKYGVQYSMETENTFFRELLSWTLPILIMIGLWGFLARRLSGGLQGGMMSVGKSKAKIYVETDTKVTFKDVAGAEEAEMELKEIVEFLKDPKKFERLGGRMPKGILLIGPPGTGKTLIAKAVAGEAGVPFFSTNGAEFVEMFVGVGAARVRDLFEQAKLKAPCIIFIDELDALGKVRMVGGVQGNDEKEQTLNQLLAELDGFDSRSGIVLLAATNRPEILDPALLRSGRFDRQVLVDRPDKVGRSAILKLHARKTKLDVQLDLDHIAAMTPGFTGADLANLVNEASLVAVRRNAEAVAESDFTEAIERMLAGLEKKNKLINKFERNVVAHHEMGHAIVASALCVDEAIHKVSIIPRGVGSLGYTLQRPTEDRFLMTKDELEKKMSVLLGGRAAERVIFNHLSTGAADDLDKATDIAWSATTRYGMSERLGDVVYEKPSHSFLGEMVSLPKTRNYSDETAHQIDGAVREMIQVAFERAEEILVLNEDLLRSSAKLLLEKETLNEAALKTIFSQIQRPHKRQCAT
jgi:cell division protease FtsH